MTLGKTVNKNYLQVYGNITATGLAQDGNDRPSIYVTGNYPALMLLGGGASNGNHGSTLSLAAFDTATATSGSFKAFTFGTPGYNATWMDLGYGTSTNPHLHGIAGASYGTRIVRFNSDKSVYFDGNVKVSSGYDVIHSGNISSQSVNYANSAGGVAWGNVSGKPSTFAPSSHDHDGRYSYGHQSSFAFNATHNSNYVTFDQSAPAGAPDGNWYNGFVSTHNNYLSSYIINKHRTSDWYVGYSENTTAPTWYKLIHSGNYADYTVTKTGSGASGTWGINITGSAGSVSWSNVTNKPFNWSGQSGQPSWLWGSNDGTNYYVWNPSNFSVNYANSAGYIPGQLCINGGSNEGTYGISLYRSEYDYMYGIKFTQTSNWGTCSYDSYGVTGDWATYFTMDNTAHRGWIFRTYGVGNVASISNDGHLTLISNGITFCIGSLNSSWCHFENNANINYYFSDSVYADGQFYLYSDRTKKKDIQKPSRTSLERLYEVSDKLLKKYTLKTSGEESYGYIAQEIEQYIPEAVTHGPDKSRTVSYNVANSVIIAALVQKVKELENIIKNGRN